MYFELSINEIPGVAMSPQNACYDGLMSKQKLIIDRIMSDYEKHKEIAGDRFIKESDKENEELEKDIGSA